MNKKNIIIFTNGNIFSLIILSNFLLLFKKRILKIVIVKGDYKGRAELASFLNFISCTSIFYTFYKVFTILLMKFFKLFYNLEITSVQDFSKKLNIDVCFAYDINSCSLYDEIKGLHPQYLLSVSCPQLIKKEWLDLVKYNGINIHSSLLPAYAGLAPYFWVLSNGEKLTGVSVHYLVKGFDKGNLLSQQQLLIHETESCMSLFTRQSCIGRYLLLDAFEKLEKGNLGEKQNLESYSYYSHPSTRAYFKLRSNGHSLFVFQDIQRLKKELTLVQKDIRSERNG